MGTAVMQRVKFADDQESIFQAAKRLKKCSAVLQGCQFSDAN